eukprot:6491407-Amphidinium_carterae.6
MDEFGGHQQQDGEVAETCPPDSLRSWLGLDRSPLTRRGLVVFKVVVRMLLGGSAGSGRKSCVCKSGVRCAGGGGSGGSGERVEWFD